MCTRLVRASDVHDMTPEYVGLTSGHLFPVLGLNAPVFEWSGYRVAAVVVSAFDSCWICFVVCSARCGGVCA